MFSSPADSADNKIGRDRSRRMLSTGDSVSSRLQLLLDIATAELLLFVFVRLKGIGDAQIYLNLGLITAVLMWLIYSNAGVYRRFSGHINRAMNIFWAWSKVFAVLIAWAFVAKVSAQYSREVIISWFVAGGIVQFLTHMTTNYLLRTWMLGRREIVPSLMVGNSTLGAYLADHINANPWVAHKIVGVLSDEQKDGDDWVMGELPRLGDIADMRDLVKRYKVRRVYFALPMKTAHQIREMELELLDLNVDIVWAPDIFGLHMTSPSVKEVAGVPLYYLSESPLVGSARISKMLMDKVLACVALLLLSPVMIGAAVAVKLSSPGPIFFRQPRHGLDGRIIQVLKFRSMKLHEEADGQVTQARQGDSRITKVGAFMRKTSIDELPQILNVLRGDMSLVGPRPHAVAHNEYYTGKVNAYMSRHRILPGMTGLAQVNGYRGETDTLDKMEKRVEYDLAYINNWSLWLDIRIMIKTAYTLLSKNAY
ncbi:undecaprenyl-phosphate glucose phosphotransferase [Mariprofundus ferrooxydans]|uniref:undecaprenyl-phosphate glucose phosphotransferase n=1 Tax=Mariprofundus ferrooxydans TaxID=314344 RepID=UPI00037A35BB|nr:undecaprenyl-phosphate glucose phosphotransferase [Mariprofundus ferrooxydans]